ncbi:PRC-barrel domain-containing protein [Azospirillum rugosum]|uniref:Sporulation protein YlmC with PRC-barrel domain n=1 Tax=Azospirillum rugosum TaxID=416170 RepID=A0ABS4SW67_9PROT|nr:PRC-barrel domain-containing protein [Azospirillum rugosum]MBP2296712.1 sporulation protein YlmC with PRC-barrel domain [Azospirillum rugosum]MDQ0530475.1 sporulation protein YlmC with PRC-barrel domain [Azospirillum rugosum]
MRRLILSATMIAGALGPWATLGPALAQGAAPSCPDGIDRLGQRIAAFEAAGAQSPASATPQEIGQLRALRQTAERAGQGGNEPACQTILGEAGALVRSIEKPRVVAADDLAKAKLHSPNGEEMGSISELVVDPDTGRVAYAVVELGGFLGLGQRNFPVPWTLVQATQNGDGYVLNVPKDRLTAAPQFTNSNRPDMSDRQWAMALHTYYGVQPYWIRDSAALAAAGLPVGATGSPQVQQEVQRLSQEVDRLRRELAQARTLGDTAAQQKPGTPAAPSAGGSGDTPPAPAQGGSTPPSPPQPQ